MTKKIKIGKTYIGGGSEILIQSMLNIPASDINASVQQAIVLEKAGCEVIRAAVPTISDVKLISALKENLSIPVVADIHFDYKIAIECANAGVDKIRINPGNIGNAQNVKEVIKSCEQFNIPIRIGVNSGSVNKKTLQKYGKPCAEALCESAMEHVKLLEKYDFNNIIVSIKSSNVFEMVKSYELISEMCNYPLHLGVTEAGTKYSGLVKSSIGIGSLLLKGIGDTIRVSLTADPFEEIIAAKEILKALELRNFGVKIISCPTCGRTKINLINLAEKIEKSLINCQKEIKVAVMGCAVNGPGEAKEADIGVAGGNGEGLIFKKGKIIKKVKEEDIISALMEQIDLI